MRETTVQCCCLCGSSFGLVFSLEQYAVATAFLLFTSLCSNILQGLGCFYSFFCFYGYFFISSADSERKTALAWNIGLRDGKDFAKFFLELVALKLGEGFARTGLAGWEPTCRRLQVVVFLFFIVEYGFFYKRICEFQLSRGKKHRFCGEVPSNKQYQIAKFLLSSFLSRSP